MTTVSVLTLVDSVEHLAQAHESLAEQTSSEWEWLIVPLGAVVLPADLVGDGRVRVLDPPGFVAAQGIPGRKEFGFREATGSHVLELDQHDFLDPRAISTIATAIAMTNADVLYTDFANVPVDGEPHGYQPQFGWESYEAEHRGRRYRAIRAFDTEPSALHQAAYAPSHGLTWKRETFFAIEGHDPTVGNADTFDLVCRAYINGASFAHIAECLVFSRQHAYRRRDLDLEARVTDMHVYDIVGEWARRSGLPMLDLGAAHNAAPGYVSVDLRNADINCDIRMGLPVEDASVACIRAFDFLEHINHCPDSSCLHGADGRPRCVVGVMNELYRALVPGGWMISRTPSTDGRGAFQDPTHTSFWNPNSFWYYTRADQARFIENLRCRFQATRIWQLYPTPWHEANDILYVHADLVALKGQRQPGICEI